MEGRFGWVVGIWQLPGVTNASVDSVAMGSGLPGHAWPRTLRPSRWGMAGRFLSLPIIALALYLRFKTHSDIGAGLRVQSVGRQGGVVLRARMVVRLNIAVKSYLVGLEPGAEPCRGHPSCRGVAFARAAGALRADQSAGAGTCESYAGVHGGERRGHERLEGSSHDNQTRAGALGSCGFLHSHFHCITS